MDKLFEQVFKHLPADIVPVALAAAAAFFGVYYYKAFRNYTDVLHDSLFLSTIVVIVAGSLLYRFNRTDEPQPLATDPVPLLLVPEFVGDERGQFKTLFIQQVESAIQGATKRDKPILILNSFLLDQDSARVTALRYKAAAVIFGPKIVRAGDKTYICFNLLRVDPDVSKPYPISAVELDKQILNDITETLAIANSVAQAKLGAPPSRLDVLEKRIAELEIALTKLLLSDKSSITEATYRHRRAIVVGVDQHSAGKLPNLRYSISDARRIASLLRGYEFEVTILENATSASIEHALERETSVAGPDDLFLFYFAGNSIRSDELKEPGDLSLIMGTFDLNLEKPKANLTLLKIVERLRGMSTRHKLLILDACHGTAGLKMADLSDSTIQIFVGSQDDQYASEGPEFGGGVFTNALIEALQKIDEKSSVSMDRLAKEVSAQMAILGPSRQQPKLVTAPGAGQIVWTRGRS
jgi:hypothetical protein